MFDPQSCHWKMQRTVDFSISGDMDWGYSAALGREVCFFSFLSCCVTPGIAPKCIYCCNLGSVCQVGLMALSRLEGGGARVSGQKVAMLPSLAQCDYTSGRYWVPVSAQSFKKEIDKLKLFGGQGPECWSIWTPGYLRNKILVLSEKTRQNLRSLSKYSWIAIMY